MDTKQLPIAGGILYFIITIAYLILFFFIQFKLARHQKLKGKKFQDDAVQDGRKVIAHLDSYYVDNSDEKHPYVGEYSYIAPNGKLYNMKGYDCIYDHFPPEERIIYLHPRNYHKYYFGSMDLGKHKNLFVILTYLLGFIVYWLMMKFLILPIILPGLFT